ncbi:MAG: hypothetical protein K2L83_07515 [Muribaculaceae bacterium]|nr:hypothetical protein [Muribaculaceae bacterium]
MFITLGLVMVMMAGGISGYAGETQKGHRPAQSHTQSAGRGQHGKHDKHDKKKPGGNGNASVRPGGNNGGHSQPSRPGHSAARPGNSAPRPGQPSTGHHQGAHHPGHHRPGAPSHHRPGAHPTAHHRYPDRLGGMVRMATRGCHDVRVWQIDPYTYMVGYMHGGRYYTRYIYPESNRFGEICLMSGGWQPMSSWFAIPSVQVNLWL